MGPGSHTRALLLLLLLVTGMGLRVAALCTYERDLDGDEAVVGLMAHRIWSDGEPFASWPGRRYNGGAAINAYLGALAFFVLGPSAQALKAVALLWTLGTLLVGYAFARDFLGRPTARRVLVLLAIAPPMFCRWGAKPYLGTTATLINLLAAYCFYRSLFGPRRSWPWWLWPTGAGLFAGLAAYNSPFALPMLAAGAAVGLWVRRDFWRRRGFWAGAAALAIAAGPTLVWMAQGEAEELTPRTGVASLGMAVARAAVKLPHAFSNPNRYFGAPALPASASAAGLCAAAGLLACVILLWGRLRRAASDPRGDVPAAAAGGALLFLAAHGAAFCLSAQDVQYLLPAYPFAALVAATAWAEGSQRRRGAASRRAAWAMAGLFVAANAWGGAAVLSEDRKGFDKYVYGNVESSNLVRYLQQARVRHVYASSAVAHVLTFESRRRVVAVSYDRVFPDDVRRLRADPGNGGYVFATDSDYDRQLGAYLRRHGIRCTERRFGVWTVRHRLSAPVRPWNVDWQTDHLGSFPHRVELFRAARRLDPWDPHYGWRLLQAEQDVVTRLRRPRP